MNFIELFEYKIDRNNHSSKVALYTKPILMLAIATVAFSVVPILYRVSEEEISAEATIFNRFWITALLLGIWKTVRTPANVNNQEASESLSKPVLEGGYILLWSLGAVYFLFQLSWSQSLLSTSVANSTILHNMTPIFLVIYECLFERHQFKPRRLMPIAIAVIGIFLLESDGFYFTKKQIVGDSLAALSAIFNAVYLSVSEKLQKVFDIVTILLLISAIGTVMALFVLLIEHNTLFPTSFFGWMSVTAVAILSQILGNTLLISSLNVLPSYFVALFLLLDPALSSVEAWIFFGEQLSILQCSSFFFIVASIVIAISNFSTQYSDRY